MIQDVETPLVHYGVKIELTDVVAISERDLPPGLPAWMRSLDAWAARLEEERMRTVVVSNIVSLDGSYEGPGGAR